jgi:hypothetical protein
MSFVSQAAPTGAHIASEGNGTISREPIVLLSGQGVVPAGAVLGRITAAGANLGKYAQYNNAATDGRNTAYAVLWGSVDTTSADGRGAAHVRHCEVFAERLAWLGGTDAAAKTAAYADLATASIITR